MDGNCSYWDTSIAHVKTFVENIKPVELSLFHIYLDLAIQASIRNRPDILELLYSNKEVNFSFYEEERYYYSAITPELREVFIKNEGPCIKELIDEGYIKKPDEFGGIDTKYLQHQSENKMHLEHTI